MWRGRTRRLATRLAEAALPSGPQLPVCSVEELGFQKVLQSSPALSPRRLHSSPSGIVIEKNSPPHHTQCPAGGGCPANMLADLYCTCPLFLRGPTTDTALSCPLMLLSSSLQRPESLTRGGLGAAIFPTKCVTARAQCLAHTQFHLSFIFSSVTSESLCSLDAVLRVTGAPAPNN